MAQLVQLQSIHGEFARRNTAVIAVAQEESDLKSLERVLRNFGPSGPSFQVVADLEHKKTKRYDRLNAYLIDKEGIVRQVFPMSIRWRPSWQAVLSEVDQLADGT